MDSIPCANACVLMQHGAKLDVIDITGEYPWLMDECEHGTDCPLIRHFNKLKLIGCQADQGVLRALPNEIRDFLNTELESTMNPEFVAELEDLKGIQVCWLPRKSLYDILFLKKTDLSKFAGNNQIDKLFGEAGQDFKMQFPHFGFILNRNYQELIKKRMLLGVAGEKFEIVIGGHLPSELSKIILCYLDNKDLEILSKAWL